MKLFDNLVNGHFQKKSDGKTVFFPYGRTGYILAPEEEVKIRTFLKDWYMFSEGSWFIWVVLWALEFSFANLRLLFGLFILSYLFYYLRVKRLTSNAQIQEITYRERVKNIAIARGLRTCSLVLIAWCLMTSASVYGVITIPSIIDKFILASCAVFFGYYSILYIFVVKYAISSKKS